MVSTESKGTPGRAERLPLALVAVLGLALLVHTIINFDLWWHLAAGRHIVTHGRLPVADPFSYISPKNEIWNDHEWLFQSAAYVTERACGVTGLTLAQVAAIGMGLAFLFLASRRTAWPEACAALLVAMVLASERFMVRAEMVSLMMIPVYVWALSEYVERGRAGGMRFLPAAQIVWANSHPGHIIGLALVGAYACGETMGTLVRRGAKHRALRLWVLVGLCFCGALVNPYGVELLVHPIRQTQSHVFMRGIIEWQSPFVRAEHPSLVLELFKGYLAVMAILFVVNVRRMRPAEALVVLGMGWAACKSRRHFGVFAFASTPIFARWLGTCMRLWGRRTLAACVAAVSLAMLWAVATNRFYVHEGTPKTFGLGLSPSQFPERAVEFVKQQDLRGNMFNNYDIGGYLSWRCYPSRQVFFDGRNFVYKEKLYEMYRSSLTDWDAWRPMAELYGVEYVILKHSSAALGTLLPALARSADWKTVHVDPVGIVFVRSEGPNAAIPGIDRAALAPPRALSTRRGLPGAVLFPCEDVAMGNLCRTLGMHDLATEWYRRALNAYPHIAQVHNDLGGVLSLRGRHEEAVQHFRRAVSINPRLSAAHLNLGIEHARLKQWDAAAASLSEAVRRNPDNAKAHHNLASVLVEQGQTGRAIAEFREAIALDEQYLLPRYGLVRALIVRREWDAAHAQCRQVLKKRPDDIQAKRLLDEIEGTRKTTGSR